MNNELDIKALHFFVPAKVHTSLKLLAIHKNITLKELLNEILSNFLKGNK